MGRASLSAPSRPSPTCSLRNPREPRIGEQLLQRLANRTPASAVEVLGDVVSLLRLAEFTELDVESMVSPALREIVYRIQCLVAVCRRGHHRHFRRQPAAVEAERGDVVQQAILGLRIRHGAPGTSTSPAASSPVAQRAEEVDADSPYQGHCESVVDEMGSGGAGSARGDHRGGRADARRQVPGVVGLSVQHSLSPFNP